MGSYLNLLREIREEFARSPKSTARWDVGTAFAGRWIYRPLGMLAAPAFIMLSMSANQVTLLSFIVGMTGISLFLLGDPSLFLIGAICYMGFVVLDFSDGLVARHERKSTHYGKMMDHLSGAVVAAFAPIFVGFGVARADQVPDLLLPMTGYLLLASLASVVNLLGKELSASFALEQARVARGREGERQDEEGRPGGLAYLVRRTVFHATSSTSHLMLLALILLDLTYLFPPLLLVLASVKLLVVLASIFRTGPRVLAIEKA